VAHLDADCFVRHEVAGLSVLTALRGRTGCPISRNPTS
jgi:hypothetical protein